MNEIERYIHDHKNPVMKVELTGKKMFFKGSTKEEFDMLEKCHKNLYKVLSHSKVEKRCARAQAEWCPGEKMAKVTKVVKGLLQNFGYQNKNGVFLYPEESLFLLETNRLELTFNGNPVTVQNGYDWLLKTLCNLNHYKIYKKMVLHGYRLIRYSVMLERKDKAKERKTVSKEEYTSCGKRKLENEDNIEQIKRQCSILEEKDTPVKHIIQQLFIRMQNNAPKISRNTLEEQIPEYCVFISSNKTRREFDYYLIICEDDLITKENSRHDKPTLYGVSTGDNIAFYKVANIHLPFLECDFE